MLVDDFNAQSGQQTARSGQVLTFGAFAAALITLLAFVEKIIHPLRNSNPLTRCKLHASVRGHKICASSN
jgi:hypothetical protein